jgi:thiol-disulfide isomerase/thioredoxin
MENVLYLEESDIVNGILLPHVGQGKPVIVMAQGNFCGYCKSAKPAFVAFSKSDTGVIAASIEIDGEPTEKAAAQYLSKWDSSYRGVPFYIGFGSDGKFKKTHTGGRDADSLITFANSL